MTSSAQLEREAEQTRSQLAQTLDELRERITPGQLMDQVVDYAKGSGGGEFVRNLGRQMSANPLPVCVMAAGMAWLMMSGRRPPVMGADGGVDDMAHRTQDSLAGTAQNIADAAGDTVQQMGDAAESRVRDFNAQARGGLSMVSDNVSSGYAAGKEQAAAIGDAISDQYDRVTDAASRAGSRIAQGTSSATQQTAQATRNFLQFCAEQPLVLAGLGLAMGAAFGATLPQTETENRLMGESSEKLKSRAQDFAQEQYAKAEEATQAAAQAIKPTPHEEEATDRAHDQEPSHMEASLVPDPGERERGAVQEEAAERRHGFVE